MKACTKKTNDPIVIEEHAQYACDQYLLTIAHLNKAERELALQELIIALRYEKHGVRHEA